MKLLFIPLLLLAPAQQTVEPIRVALSAPRNEVNEALAKAVRVELRKFGDVAIVERNADYLIQFNAAPLVGKCNGYVAAVVVAERETRNANLEAYSGPTLEQIARYVVSSVNRENFAPRRGKVVSKK